MNNEVTDNNPTEVEVSAPVAPKRKLKKLQEIKNGVKYKNKMSKPWNKNLKGKTLNKFLKQMVDSGALEIEDLEAFFNAPRL